MSTDAPSSRELPAIKFVGSMTAATAVGEAVALAATTTLSTILSDVIDEAESPGMRFALQLGLVVAGALEGAVLGTSQWFALAYWLPAIPQGRFIAFTSGAMAASWWIASLMVGLESDNASHLGFWPAIHGALVGMLIAGGQAWALRSFLRRPWRFVIGSTVGWALGMLATPTFANWIHTEASNLHWIAGTALSGLVVGAIAGLLSAIGLRWALAD